MNELNASGVAAVCSLDMLCMVLLVGLYFFTRNITARSGKKVSGLIGIGIALYSLLLITNDIWIIGEYTGDIGVGVQYFVNSSYFLALSAAPALWFLHVSIEFGLPFGKKKIATAAVMAPAVLLSFFSVTAYANKLLFYFDGAGKYMRGPFYAAFSILSYGYIIASALIALVEYIRRRDRERLRALFMLFYALLVILFGVLQNLTGFEFGVLGFTAGTVLYFAYLITRENNSQKKAIEEQQKALEEALSMAESSSRSKTDFLFNMSHDIRTPMNAVIGFNNMALSHIDEKETVENCLKKIGSSSRQLLSLINDVLDMSRIESGAVRCEYEPVDVVSSMTELVDILRESTQKDLTFRVDLDEVEHRYVVADRFHTDRILMNVLGNSVKYTPDGGRITVTLRETASAGEEGVYGYDMIVEDNGIGMSEEFLEHIFEVFAREKTSTVSGTQGTGLGMAITKKLVDLLGGTIRIQSKLGEGTRTTIHLEMKGTDQSDVSVAGQTSAEEPDDLLKGKKVLLVEDNELNREIAVDILSEEGMIVDTAEDGDIAVEKMKNAEAGRYDIILMDVQMPRMNGYEATRAIRELPDPYASGIPIVAMTANAFEEDKQNAFASGMNGHLSKPIDLAKLKAEISRFVL